MIKTGRIYDILEINDKVIQVIIRQRDRGKLELAAFSFYGFWKDKALEQGIRQKDKVKIQFRVRSNLYNGKYYTDAVAREIYIVEKAPYKFDASTGELF